MRAFHLHITPSHIAGNQLTEMVRTTSTPSENYVKSLVDSMPAAFTKGCNISMDRLYTAISTSNWLLTKNITAVGTLVANRIGLPDEVKSPKEREEFSSTIHWEKENGNLALCSYTVKSKSKGKRNVLVMSTMRPLMGITQDDGKAKPAIIKFYDFTKGGTDIMDQRMAKYSTKSYTKRWTMVNFFYILDTIRCNATTLYALKHKMPVNKVKSFDVGMELVLSLVKPHIENRSTVGLSSTIISKMSFILGRKIENQKNPPVNDDGELTSKDRRDKETL